MANGSAKNIIFTVLILVFMVTQHNDTYAHEGGSPIDEYGCHHYIINGEYHNYHENNPERPCEPDVIPDALIVVRWSCCGCSVSDPSIKDFDPQPIPIYRESR